MTVLFYGIAFLLVVALCATAIKDYSKFLFFGAFLVNFHSIGIDIGVYMTLDKIFSWIGIFIILCTKVTLPNRRWFHAFIGLLGYMTLLTGVIVVSGALDKKIAYAHGMGLGLAQSTLLLPVQLISQVTMWLIFLIGYKLGRHEHIIDGFIWGAVCNAGIGFYQLLAQVKGLPWLPASLLAKWSSGDLDSQFSMQPSHLYRLAGLAGEPKHAASCFVFAIILMMCFPVNGLKWKLPVLTIALLATFSTSGWFAFAAIYGVFMLYQRKFLQILIAVAIVLLVMMATHVSHDLTFIVDSRIMMRFADPGAFEPKDSALLDVIKNEPEILVTGTGAGGIDLYLMQWINKSKLEKDGLISPSYILTEILGDYGLIGIVLFALFLQYIRPYFSGDMQLFFLTAIMAILMLPRFSIMPPALLVLGALMKDVGDKMKLE